jgi:hypothetical protein
MFRKRQPCTNPAIHRASAMPGQDVQKYDRKLPEAKMTKSAFDKIKAGLDDAKAYLDGLEGKRGYDALRYYLERQKLPEFVLSFEQIEEIIDAALPRAAHRASWWETLRSPQEKMPQREACLAGGYIATRLADGKSVRFKRVPHRRDDG